MSSVTAMEQAQKEALLPDQVTRLPRRQLIIVFWVLALTLFLALYDTTSVASAYTQIAQNLNAGDTIVWVGTSYLIANTSSQLIYGRLSDIFGRKHCLMGALFIFGLGDLLSGFSKTPIQLYVFRAWTGIGAGGMMNMAMVIISDLTSLSDRNKWQGYISVSIALGSSVGPFVGAALGDTIGWRYIFWLSTPCAAICFVLAYFFIPLKPATGSTREKVAKLDYLGCLTSLGGNCCLLVAITSGGSVFPWKSAQVISLATIGGVFWIVFVIVEWKVAKLPVLPPRLFTYRSPAIVIINFWFAGVVYYVTLFFLPRYFQVLLHMSPMESALVLLSLLLVQSFSSFVNGQVTRFSGQAKFQIITGFGLYLIGVSLETTFNQNTSKARIVAFLVIQGLGAGGTLGSSLVAAQAGAPPEDRAIVTGARNFTRTFGGAVGLTISNAILQNTLVSRLPKTLPDDIRRQIINGASLDLPLTIDAATREQAYAAYQSGLHSIWIMMVPMTAICFINSFFLKSDKFYDAAKMPQRAATTTVVEEIEIQEITGDTVKGINEREV